MENREGRILRDRRTALGLTQQEVAEKVGLSLAYVNRITKGREQIVNKTFVKMMDELAMAGLRAGICGGEHIEKWNKTRSEQHSSDRRI